MSKNWLSRINERTRINCLAIPGTHDAASYSGAPMSTGKSMAPLTITQQIDITQQLNAGVRVLDMRVAHVEAHSTGGWIRTKTDVPAEVYMCHGPIVFNTKLSEALASIKRWLGNHPSEFVAMIFQQQGTKPDLSSDPLGKEKRRIVQIIKKIITDAFPGDWMYRPANGTNDWPTVGELGKKVMVFSRLEDDFPGAFDLQAWGDNLISKQYDIPKTNLKVAIQDRYKEVTNTDFTKEFNTKNWMSNDVREVNKAKWILFDKLRSQYNDDPTLKINHLSHSCKAVTWNQPWKIGADINQRLKTSLENESKRYRGFVMIDDANAAICKSIIDSNVIFMTCSRRGVKTADDLPLAPPERWVKMKPRAKDDLDIPRKK